MSDRRTRRAVLAVFAANGIGWASWASRLPEIRDKLDLSEGALGLALLGATVGLFVAAALTGFLILRFGSRSVTVVAGLAMSAIILLIGWAPVAVSFAAALIIFGLGNGALDLASNAQAAGIERRAGRSTMSGVHALFSGGAIIGALGASLAAVAHVPVEVHLTLVGFVLAALVTAAAPGLAAQDERPDGDTPALALPTGRLVGLAALAFCVLLAEGAVFDWSAIYLRSVAGAEPAVAAIGLAVFQAAMMVGRLGGDAGADRLGAARLVRGGVALGGAGLLVAILVPSVPSALGGYLVLGLGLAATFPLTLGAAARAPGVSIPTALAATTAAGYTGFMVGPPLIGFVAELSSLRIGLVVVLLCLAVAFVLAPRLGRRPS